MTYFCSALGSELLIPNLDAAGTFMSFQASAGGVTVKDEVWVTGSDVRTDRIVGMYYQIFYCS
jgi:hypothetical protein